MTVLYRVAFYVVIIYNSLFSALYLVYQDFHSQTGTVFCLSFSIGGYPFCVSSTLSRTHLLFTVPILTISSLFTLYLRFIAFFSSWSPIPCVRKHLQLELRTYSTVRNPCPVFLQNKLPLLQQSL
jgi:hypothetical protein